MGVSFAKELVATALADDELPKADIILDCCGDLINHKASAYAELTQSGSKKYQEFTDIYRILDVDNTKLKFLEDYYGTGDGFIRALNKSEDFNFSNKSFFVRKMPAKLAISIGFKMLMSESRK